MPRRPTKPNISAEYLDERERENIVIKRDDFSLLLWYIEQLEMGYKKND